MSPAFWWLGLLVGFLLLLVVPALVLESRWAREWMRRLDRMEQGRARQRADYIARGCFWSDTH